MILELEEIIGEHRVPGKTWLFGSENPTMTDIFLIPYLERVVCLKHTPWEDLYYKLDIHDHVPIMIDMVEKFRNLDAFKGHVFDVTAYGKHLDKYKENPNFKPKYVLDYLE